jgi:hypothetical protein
MIARTLTIAALAAALGLAACPADPTPPWGVVADGTRFNGSTLEAGTLDSIRMQKPEEDDVDLIDCQDDPCPKNGTQLRGKAQPRGSTSPPDLLFQSRH